MPILAFLWTIHLPSAIKKSASLFPSPPSSGPLPARTNDVAFNGTSPQAAKRPSSASSCATLLISIAGVTYPTTSPRQTTILVFAPSMSEHGKQRAKLIAANRTSSSQGHHLGIPFRSGALISIFGGSARRMTVYSAKTISPPPHPVPTTSFAHSASSSGTFQPSHSMPLSNFFKAKAAASNAALALI